MQRKPMIISITILAIVIFLFLAISDGSGGNSKAQADTPIETCVKTQVGITFYRKATWKNQDAMHRERSKASEKAWDIKGCKYAEWTRKLWKKKAKAAHDAYVAWHAYYWLKPTGDWFHAVMQVQKIVPDTAIWLLSCSKAEGSHGYWKWYGGRRWTGHHIGNDFLGADTVGGWMQFRFSTFDPYSQKAFAFAREKGFVLPDFGEGKYAAWLSPIGQAMTAGYMRYTNQDASHWSASWGNGC